MRTPVSLDRVRERPCVLGPSTSICACAAVFSFVVGKVMNSLYLPHSGGCMNLLGFEVCTQHII